MYTIKQAAARTGLSVPTIRAWERRYGVVSRLAPLPAIACTTRTPSNAWPPCGSLVESGGLATQPGGRAGQDAGGWTWHHSRLAGGRPVGRRRRCWRPGTASPARRRAGLRVVAAPALDVHGMERILDEAFAAQRFELAMDARGLPGPAGGRRAWAAGELDVAAEHAASETVRRRLARFFDAARSRVGRPQALIGMPPGGQHELGVFAFAVACRRAGLEVLYLGANVPLESWLRMVRETDVPAVVLGAVATVDSASLAVVVDAIQTIDRPPTCFAGGPARWTPMSRPERWNCRRRWMTRSRWCLRPCSGRKARRRSPDGYAYRIVRRRWPSSGSAATCGSTIILPWRCDPRASTVAPLFVLDPAILHGRFASPNRTWFMLGAVRSLAEALDARGSRLTVRVGRPKDVVPAFAADIGASEVFVSRDYSPFGRSRDRAVAESAGRAWASRSGPEPVCWSTSRSMS